MVWEVYEISLLNNYGGMNYNNENCQKCIKQEQKN